MKSNDFSFRLFGKALVLIDWANFFGTTRKRWIINPKKFFGYLKKYREISRICFFYGEDNHEKSREFLAKIQKIGFELFTKKVKKINGQRKCDFDVEIAREILLNLKNFDEFLLFSGDGDYALVLRDILDLQKRLFVISARGSMGREIFELRDEWRDKKGGKIILSPAEKILPHFAQKKVAPKIFSNPRGEI